MASRLLRLFSPVVPEDEHETLICMVVLTHEWERGNGTYKEICWLFFFFLNFHDQPAINSGLKAKAGKPPYQYLKRLSSLAASGKTAKHQFRI